MDSPPVTRSRRASSIEEVAMTTNSFYSKLIGLRSKIGLDIKRNKYQRMPNEENEVDFTEASDKATVAQTYFTFFKSFMGIGVLALPHGFLLAGWWLGICMVLMASYTSYYCITLLLESRDTVENQINAGTVDPNVLPAGMLNTPSTVRATEEDVLPAHEPKDITYSDIGRAAFGSMGAKIVDFAIVTAQIGFSTAYMIFIGNNVEAALGTCIGPATWMVITAVLACPLVWLRSLKKLSFGAILADVAVVFGLAVIIIYAFNYAEDKARVQASPPYPTGPKPFIFFGMAVFAFEGAGIILPMKQSMQHPEEFAGILKTGMMVITIVYTMFPLVVYLCFGGTTKDMITANLPDGEAIVVVVELSYSIGLYLTYPIQMFPAIQILEESRVYRTMKRTLEGKTFDNELGPSYLFRTVLVLVTLLCATTIPKFGTFVAIVGSVSCSLIAFILPAAFSIKLHPEERTTRKTYIKWGMLLFGLIGGLVSLVVELEDLTQSIGAPSTDANFQRCNKIPVVP
jgi:solute carrier family 36 (proton-coupled amino acid transporter)